MSEESGSEDLQRAQIFFQSGNDAALKSNFDYAIDMYKRACKIVPDNLVYRQAMCESSRRKFNGDPSRVSGMLVGQRISRFLMRESAKSKGNPTRRPSSSVRPRSSTTPWDVRAARRGGRSG